MGAGIPLAILSHARTRDDVQVAMDAATLISEHQVRSGAVPPWWEGTARYRREAQETLPGVERVNTAEELHAMGAGDCDDHAPALAGSLRAFGIPARAIAVESPGIGYHIIVAARRADGSIAMLDPSLERGMLGEIGRRKRTATTRAGYRRRLRQAASLIQRARRLNPLSRAARVMMRQADNLLREAEDYENRDEESDDSIDE